MKTFCTLIIGLILASCNQQQNTQERDFIDRREFEFNLKLLFKEETGRSDNIIQLFAKPRDSDEAITLNLNVGPTGYIRSVATLESYLLLEVSGHDHEYRLNYRNVFSRADELNGIELPISEFRHIEAK